jgi:hypothetical protein
MRQGPHFLIDPIHTLEAPALFEIAVGVSIENSPRIAPSYVRCHTIR